MNYYQRNLAKLARECAKGAETNPDLNDMADILYAACAKAGVDPDLLPTCSIVKCLSCGVYTALGPDHRC